MLYISIDNTQYFTIWTFDMLLITSDYIFILSRIKRWFSLLLLSKFLVYHNTLHHLPCSSFCTLCLLPFLCPSSNGSALLTTFWVFFCDLWLCKSRQLTKLTWRCIACCCVLFVSSCLVVVALVACTCAFLASLTPNLRVIEHHLVEATIFFNTYQTWYSVYSI